METAAETLADSAAAATPRSILVLGLTQRVGTNYLARLLHTHPDCTKPSTLYEDFLVSGLPHLERYLHTVTSSWKETWDAHQKAPELRRLLGSALVQFVQSDTLDPRKRTVLKTPSVEGLAHAGDFLRDFDVLVLTRFGPDVVESGMKSFGWSFEQACLRWGRAARSVADLMDRRQEGGGCGFTVVRYEDLVREPEASLRRIFERVGLDPRRFDFAAVGDFPVYGSSVERGGKDKVHWQPVARPQAFNPLGRSAHWTPAAFRRFDWLTEGVSARLGYQLPYSYQDRTLSRLLHRLRDQKPRLRQRLHALSGLSGN